ncbi:MAG TPA: hypothetical protein VIM65_14320 [Cyclobacteriaceae bacterium]
MINFKLYFNPEVKVIGRDTVNNGLIKELHGLKASLKNNADKDMQALYPEGYIFMNAMYSLAWCNVIGRIDRKSELFTEGTQEINIAYHKINSGIGRAPFDPILPIPYGAFYIGWSSYVLGKKLSLEPVEQRNKSEVKLFKYQCKIIAEAIKNHFYPTSYRGQAWPADAVVCLASLSLHDKIFAAQYSYNIKNWLTHVKATLDSAKMIPHSVYASSGKPLEASRGSSLSLMLIFLKEIDTDFAAQQYLLYKKHFVDTRLGLLGIREYRIGDYGIGDVDSGPVIFQMGSSATIVGMGTTSVYGDFKTSAAIRNAIEAFGFPTENKNDEKCYLFNTLPIADSFIAWAHSFDKHSIKNESSFMIFHFYSMGMMVVLLLIVWYIWKPSKPSSIKSLHVPW